MDNIEKKLADIFKKKYCCFTGNGTTAIYLILQALDIKNKRILYPAITCTNPVNSAVYANYEVMFCDVNLKDYTFDLEKLEEMIKKYNIGVIVPTHIYGNRCDMSEIYKLCKKYNVFILEDAAQSIYFDESSDASIISFGHTKIFHHELGGGAVFTNNKELFVKIKKIKANLDTKPLNSNELFDIYREKYYSIVNSKLPVNQKNKELYKLQIDSKENFIFDLNAYENILKIFEEKNVIIEQRKDKALLYHKYLNNSQIEKPWINFENIIPWRYSFLFKGNRNKLLEVARKRNIDISSWYRGLNKIYLPDGKEKYPNAEYLEKHIINLWVDSTHSENDIKKDIDSLNNIMKEI